MIDTIELKYPLTSTERELVFDAINNCAEDNFHNYAHHIKYKKLHPLKNMNQSWHTAAFNNWGILDIKLYINPKHGRNDIYIKFKPAKIIYKSDVYALSQNADFNQACKIFNDFIDYINNFTGIFKLPYINTWKVNRIDYAYQLRSKYYEEYINLFQKGYKESADNKYKTSAYISNNNTTVNFYDKTVQQHLDLDEHVIRLEVQCKKRFLQYLKDRKKISCISLRNLWNNELAASIVRNKIINIFGSGDFMNIKTAENQFKLFFGTKKVHKLILLMKLSKHNKIQKCALDKLYMKNYADAGTGKWCIKNLLECFNKAGVNSIAIPDCWKCESLVNPINLIPDLQK